MTPLLLLMSLAIAAQPAGTEPALVLDNAQVRVYEATVPSFGGVDRAPAVVVFLDDVAGHHAGDALWTADASIVDVPAGARVAIVEPKAAAPRTAGPSSGSSPGDAPFTGMSFRTLFENERVTVIRARMDVGAREAFHSHASDTIVVHLSGGSIEDTAEGVTKVNRWKHGDVEFEGRGSSHSARNVGDAVDVVLVALKPQPSK